MPTLLAQIKTLLEPLFSERVYRDRAPDAPEGGPDFPYATILDDLSRAPQLSGDAGTLSRRTLAQVDVWQETEDDDLIESVLTALDGVQLAAPRLRLRVDSAVRVPEEAGVIIHHSLTVRTPALT